MTKTKAKKEKAKMKKKTTLLGLPFDDALDAIRSTPFPYALSFTRLIVPAGGGGGGAVLRKFGAPASPSSSTSSLSSPSSSSSSSSSSSLLLDGRRPIRRGSSDSVSANHESRAAAAVSQPLFRGLRVRVGMFTGEPDVERDAVTKVT